MNRPTGTTLVERTEWLLGIGEPKPRSRFWVVYFALFGTFGVGVFLWYVLPGEWKEGVSISMVASLILWLWVASETAGSLLYTHRSAAWGRGLRAFGWAVFFPLAMGCFVVAFWLISTFVFVVEAACLGGWFVWLVVRLDRLAWQSR